MVIFRYNEDWFAMITPIKPNISLRISSEPSQNVFKSFKVLLVAIICCICQSNELEREIKPKTGEPSRGATKNLGAMVHSGLVFPIRGKI